MFRSSFDVHALFSNNNQIVEVKDSSNPILSSVFILLLLCFTSTSLASVIFYLYSVHIQSQQKNKTWRVDFYL